jgi:hypothetical protein
MDRREVEKIDKVCLTLQMTLLRRGTLRKLDQ